MTPCESQPRKCELNASIAEFEIVNAVGVSLRYTVLVVVCALFSTWMGVVFSQSWQYRQVEVLFDNEKIRNAIINTFPNESGTLLEHRVNLLFTENILFKSSVRVYHGELEISRISMQSNISIEDSEKIEYERENINSNRYCLAFERCRQALRDARISMTDTLPLDVASKAIMDTDGGRAVIELAVELVGEDAFDSEKIAARRWIPYIPQRDIAAALLVINNEGFRLSRSASDLLARPVGEDLILRELDKIHAVLIKGEYE